MTGAEVAPFRITPDLRFLFAHGSHDAAFGAVADALARGATMIVAVGASGLGKTVLLLRLEAMLELKLRLIAYVPYPALDIHTMLASFCADAELAAGLRDAATLDDIARSLTGRTTRVLMIDDADRCSDQLLRDLHELAGRVPGALQVILAGGPQLPARVDQVLADGASVPTIELAPLALADIEPYLRHRLRLSGDEQTTFSADAIIAIGEHSGGNPRAINQLCSRAMILARSEAADRISLHNVLEAIEDCPAYAIARSGRRPLEVPDETPLRVPGAGSGASAAASLPDRPPSKADAHGAATTSAGLPHVPSAAPPVAPASSTVARDAGSSADLPDDLTLPPVPSREGRLRRTGRRPSTKGMLLPAAERPAAPAAAPPRARPRFAGFMPRRTRVPEARIPADSAGDKSSAAQQAESHFWPACVVLGMLVLLAVGLHGLSRVDAEARQGAMAWARSSIGAATAVLADCYTWVADALGEKPAAS